MRVSTSDQNTEKFKNAVKVFAHDHKLGTIQKFYEEVVSGRKNWRTRIIKEVVDTLEFGDRLIIPELSRLGRSTLEVLEILKECKDKDVIIYSVKENMILNGSGIESKVMSTFLALFAELERDFISKRTKEGLAAARAKGVLLGRPKGKGKSKLDPHKEEIIELLKYGVPKTKISKRYNTTVGNLWLWLKRSKISVDVDLSNALNISGKPSKVKSKGRG